MSRRHLAPAFRHLRRLVAPDVGDSDAHLLRRFTQQHDESAFELLVWRHGRMVYGLCRRVLGDDHDAEDAFQATLLVLARKAASIGKGESVGSWLYKVAYRVALRARDAALKRGRRERQVPATDPPLVPAEPGWTELRAVLDEELSRLAEKHRAPLVLCYLQGLTNEEAARQLACPVGTVKTRLAQARRLLGARLTQRGLALGAALALAGALPAEAAPAAALVTTTVRAAALAAAGKVLGDAASASVVHLVEGAMRTMMVAKLKAMAVVLVLGLAVAGVGGASLSALAGGPADDKQKSKLAPAEARVKQLKSKLADLNQQLREAEEEADREKEVAARAKALPPRDKPVAVIFGDVAITRDELAEHLLSRMSAKQLERYVNLRILEHEAKAKGVRVSDAEVEAHVKETMAKSGLTEKSFHEQILTKLQMTLHEWKNEVARPQLLMKRLASKSQITDAELRSAFEARYGDKIECRVIVWPSQTDAEAVLRRIRNGDSTFDKEAERWRPNAGALSLSVPDTKPSGAGQAWLKVLGELKPGEVSEVVKHDGKFILLERRRSIPADPSVRYGDVRESLRADLSRKLRDESASEAFKELKARAKPKLLWTPPKGDEK